eukprot:NODE_11275_length_462_cov_15.250737_g10620_i0.p1 GENE.NODE_11275_length_462_cov_15.250737_g10620_i0~~NODE_11275_length_462_cov_15.250737_g10620_i0.p1  ORF type:complete len:122 (-),score=25.01 NODE_11275_length_462_cov_15.250737_g10620_i0:95-409(-)
MADGSVTVPNDQTESDHDFLTESLEYRLMMEKLGRKCLAEKIGQDNLKLKIMEEIKSHVSQIVEQTASKIFGKKYVENSQSGRTIQLQKLVRQVRKPNFDQIEI